MKPRPAKPRISIAQVEGSGTPGVIVAVAMTVLPLSAIPPEVLQHPGAIRTSWVAENDGALF